MVRQWSIARKYLGIKGESEVMTSGELLREFPHLKPFSEVIREGGLFRINWTLEQATITIKEQF